MSRHSYGPTLKVFQAQQNCRQSFVEPSVRLQLVVWFKHFHFYLSYFLKLLKSIQVKCRELKKTPMLCFGHLFHISGNQQAPLFGPQASSVGNTLSLLVRLRPPNDRSLMGNAQQNHANTHGGQRAQHGQAVNRGKSRPLPEQQRRG